MNIDPEKLLVLFVIVVLVLGPERLPQMARTLGRGLAELRKYTSALQSEVKDVLAEPRAMIDAAAHEADMRSFLHPDDASRAGTSNGSGADVAVPAWEGTVPAWEGTVPLEAAPDLDAGGFVAGDFAAGDFADWDGAALDEIAPLQGPLEWVAPPAPAGAPDDPSLN